MLRHSVPVAVALVAALVIPASAKWPRTWTVTIQQTDTASAPIMSMDCAGLPAALCYRDMFLVWNGRKHLVAVEAEIQSGIVFVKFLADSTYLYARNQPFAFLPTDGERLAVWQDYLAEPPPQAHEDSPNALTHYLVERSGPALVPIRITVAPQD